MHSLLSIIHASLDISRSNLEDENIDRDLIPVNIKNTPLDFRLSLGTYDFSSFVWMLLEWLVSVVSEMIQGFFGFLFLVLFLFLFSENG